MNRDEWKGLATAMRIIAHLRSIGQEVDKARVERIKKDTMLIYKTFGSPD